MRNMVFSIITITFNSEKTVERTLKSILGQTFKDFEYIIVDGASKDGTMDIVRKYEPLFEGRMKWKSEPDKGIYDAMNKGILRSSGTLVGIVNSDDWLEPDALENVNIAFSKNDFNTNTLYCGGIKFHDVNAMAKVVYSDVNLFSKAAKSLKWAGLRHPAVFVPLEVYTRYGLFDQNIRITSDFDLMLRFFENCVNFYQINKVLSNMSTGGISNNITYKSIKTSVNDTKSILTKRNVGKCYLLYRMVRCASILMLKWLLIKTKLYKIS